MSILSMFFLFVVPVGALAIAWWVWFFADFDKHPAQRWRRILLLGGLISAFLATVLNVLLLDHTVSTMRSNSLSVPIVWGFTGYLVAVSVLIAVVGLILGKGQARLFMGVWLFTFLGANYMAFVMFFTY
jgi:hypothetical protein